MPKIEMNPTSMAFKIGWEVESTAVADFTPSGVMEGSDPTVDGSQKEYRASRSVLGKNLESMRALKELVMETGIETNRSCGFHVHVSPVKTFGKVSLVRWGGWVRNIAVASEAKIRKMVPTSRLTNSHCLRLERANRPLRSFDYTKGQSVSVERYDWINVTNLVPGQGKGIVTIENRLMGDCSDIARLELWVYFTLYLAHMAVVCMDDPSAFHSVTEQIDHVSEVTQHYNAEQSGENYASVKQLLIPPIAQSFSMVDSMALNVADAVEQGNKNCCDTNHIVSNNGQLSPCRAESVPRQAQRTGMVRNPNFVEAI